MHLPIVTAWVNLNYCAATQKPLTHARFIAVHREACLGDGCKTRCKVDEELAGPRNKKRVTSRISVSAKKRDHPCRLVCLIFGSKWYHIPRLIPFCFLPDECMGSFL